MTRATQGKRTISFYWDTSGAELAVYARPQWADEELDEDLVAESIDGDVPAGGWRALAKDFLDRFDR
jgi:hypothetical protein